MEAGEITFDSTYENTIETSYALANNVTHMAVVEHFDNPRFESIPTTSLKKRKVDKANDQNANAQAKDTTPSVSSCYIFKSRLQEYCQKAGLTTPVYETIKEGPSHEPFFKSTVIVNDVRYDSLPRFFNRKAAEQSAAEVALVELAKSVDMKFGISQPVHETGLCKNLLQEYAQKMNYAIPLYECHKNEKQGRMPTYSCVVEIGGIKYVGASASTKKEAELKAARTATLAIQLADDQTNNSIYTVVPQKRKGSDVGISTRDKTKAVSKKTKYRFKKREFERGGCGGKGKIFSAVKMDGQDGLGSDMMNGLSSEGGTGSGGKETNANTFGPGDYNANLGNI